ncbi:MAG: hypothetical protein JNM67_09585, partial [Bacteroidetes bacterium]|nr:hypothetical protein [Bacteroidota bacterium]
NGFGAALTHIDFKNLIRGPFSYDPVSGLFYFHDFDKLYIAQQGMDITQLLGFDASYTSRVVFYKQNQFLMLGGFNKNNSLAKVNYQNGKSQKPESYEAIPGYDNVHQLATDGSNIWVCAQNTSTKLYELVKVSLN